MFSKIFDESDICFDIICFDLCYATLLFQKLNAPSAPKPEESERDRNRRSVRLGTTTLFKRVEVGTRRLACLDVAAASKPAQNDKQRDKAVGTAKSVASQVAEAPVAELLNDRVLDEESL